MGAFFNFVAAFMFTLEVAGTLGKGLVKLKRSEPICNSERFYRGYRMGHYNMVLWFADKLFPRFDGRICWSSCRKSGFFCYYRPWMYYPDFDFIVVAPVMGLVIAFILMAAETVMFH